MLVVKALKIFALALQGRVAREPLAPEKLFVVRIIELLDSTVSPWLCDGDKHRLNTKMQTKPNDHPWGSGMFMGAMKAQLVVQLKKVRKPYDLPASQQTGGNLTILFRSL